MPMAEVVGKVKHFTGRLLKNAIPFNGALSRWKVVSNPSSHACDASVETMTHTIWTCVVEMGVWKCSELTNLYK